MLSNKSRSRRSEIRKNRPETRRASWQQLKEEGIVNSIAIAVGFCILCSAILMLRQDVMPYRPGQWISHDIVSRVAFTYSDKDLLNQRKRERRESEPRIYKTEGDLWGDIEKALEDLPDRLPTSPTAELPEDIRDIFDSGSVTALRRYISTEGRNAYNKRVTSFVQALRDDRVGFNGEQFPIYILNKSDRRDDLRARRDVRIEGGGIINPGRTFYPKSDDLRLIVSDLARRHFVLVLQPKFAEFTLSLMRPTHELDPIATAQAADKASEAVTEKDALKYFPADTPLVYKVTHRALSQQDWDLLHAEHKEYVSSLRDSRWESRLGIIGIAFIVTVVLSLYIARYQPRVVKNHARALAILALMVSMLLLDQVAATSNVPLYLFGTAPTLLVAMILTIAYDQRTAIGIGTMHAVLATIALNQGIAFFIIIWVGLLTACFLLDEIRTRSKLIEVGGAAALAMAVATAAEGALAFDPWPFIFQNCLYAGAAGLGAGFVMLGILPFVEKAFRITTSMTLLELADASQPLLRRLAVEAPGTYNHSLQVATLAEAAAEAVGGDSLLCRVAAYYHDVGKINKAEYFIENQGGRENRHIHLNPSVSLLIIIGHVKDGVEMAREYNLPGSIIPFIQQHHGTTLVEYFFHQACTQQEQRQPDQPAISETQYRYPGPKPKTREVAIVMLADAVESACRAMAEPTGSRVEGLVHELAMKRLLDGQFDECDLTMRELELMERSMIKTILGIYHGRIAYPTLSAPTASPQAPVAAVRSA